MVNVDNLYVWNMDKRNVPIYIHDNLDLMVKIKTMKFLVFLIRRSVGKDKCVQKFGWKTSWNIV